MTALTASAPRTRLHLTVRGRRVVAGAIALPVAAGLTAVAASAMNTPQPAPPLAFRLADGKTIMCGAKKSGENKWKGTVLNLDDGQKYSGSVTLSGNSLTLSGCVLGGLVCKNDTWSRLK